jgi:hypothetical protein
MRMPWFRMYSEARTDRKLDLLTDEEFRIWFNLLCMASENEAERGTLVYDDLEELAIEVSRGDSEQLSHALSRLVTLKMCDVTRDTITFCNFEKRQQRKPSDLPERTRDRKRKSRLMSHDVTPPSRPVTRVTPLDKRREDKKRIRSSNVYTDVFENWWQQWPKKGDTKSTAFQSWQRLDPELQQRANDALPNWLPYYRSIENRIIPNASTWLNQARWENEPPPVEVHRQNGKVHGKPDFNQIRQQLRNGEREVIETTGRTL